MVAIFFIVLLALATAYLTYRLAGGLRLYLKLRGKDWSPVRRQRKLRLSKWMPEL